MPEVDIDQVVGGATEVVDSISLDWLTPASVARVIVCMVACFLVVRLLIRLINKLLERVHLEHALESFLRSILKALLWSVAVIIVLGAMNINVSSLVALLSVAALAVSFALQNTLSNLAGGILLLLAKPFVSGDLIEVGEYIGTVRDVDLAYTTLVTIDNRVIFIPNSTISSDRIINYNGSDKRRMNVQFCLAYGSPLVRVQGAVEKILSEDERIHKNPAYFVHVSGYKDSRVEYTVRAWCDTKDYWDVYFSFLDRLQSGLEAAGLHMTYDHLNVHLNP